MFAVAAGGWAVGRHIQSPEQATSQAAPPTPSWITATVEKRVLNQTVVSRGDVRPQVSIEIGVPSSIEGGAVVTGISVVAGDEVTEGTRVIEVSGRPVFVLAGAVPVYRTLRPGMRGPDVAQLQAALVRLGYTPEIDGSFGEATKVALTAFYDAAGYEPLPASDTAAADTAAAQQAATDTQAALDEAEEALAKLTAGGPTAGIVAAYVELDAANRAVKDATASSAAAVALAQQQLDVATSANSRIAADPASPQTDLDQAALAVSQAKAGLAESKRTGASQIADAKNRVTVATATLADLQVAADTVSATRTRDNAATARDQAVAALTAVVAGNGPIAAQGEIVFAPTLPARVQSAVTAVGPIETATADPTSAPSGALVTLAGGELVVSMTARQDARGLIRIGMAVELLDEQTNNTYDATITSIGDTLVPGADGLSGYPVTVTADLPLPDALAGTNVRVTITAASTETETLVVPLAAVSSAANGTTRVSILRKDATDPVDVAVTAGLSADGFVAITPAAEGGVVAGDRVVVGR